METGAGMALEETLPRLMKQIKATGKGHLRAGIWMCRFLLPQRFGHEENCNIQFQCPLQLPSLFKAVGSVIIRKIMCYFPVIALYYAAVCIIGIFMEGYGIGIPAVSCPKSLAGLVGVIWHITMEFIQIPAISPIAFIRRFCCQFRERNRSMFGI